MSIFKESIEGQRVYTKEVKDMLTEVSDALQPLFDKYIKMGYEPNEVHYIVSMVVIELALDETLGLNDPHFTKK